MWLLFPAILIPGPAVAENPETAATAKSVVVTTESHEVIDSTDGKTRTNTVREVTERIACPEPAFYFRRITPRTFILTVKAKQEAKFDLTIVELDPEKEKVGTTFLTKPGQLATADGEKTDVFFPRLGPILDRGGYVKVLYKPVDSVCAGNGNPRAQLVRVLDVHVLQFDGGWVNSLEHDGNWNTSPEYGIRASSFWLPWLQGMVDIRYASFGRIDTSGSGLDTLFENQGLAPANFENPFDSEGGVFRANFYLSFIPNKEAMAFSFIGGGGVTSVPGADITDLRPRFFLGAGLSVDEYSLGGGDEDAGTSGAVRFLLAYDRIWEWDEAVPNPDTTNPLPKVVPREQFGRFVIEAQLEIPGLGGRNIKPALQGYIDLPLASVFPFVNDWISDGSTQRNSAVNISVLLHFDLTALKAIVGRN